MIGTFRCAEYSSEFIYVPHNYSFALVILYLHLVIILHVYATQ
jgi:hypothetical protein